MNSNKARGFTLIELMFVVTIIAILAAIAFPSYTQHVRTAAIRDAQSSLIGLASAMERHRAQSGNYAGAATAGALSGVPAIFPTQSPESGNANFNLSITVALADTNQYTLTATATGRSSITVNDTMTLASSGARGGTGTLVNGWN